MLFLFFDVPILAYHKISDKFDWGINNVPVNAFQKQMNYLFEQNYYTLSLDDFLDSSYENNQKRHPVIITFDDSTAGHFRFIEKDGKKVERFKFVG